MARRVLITAGGAGIGFEIARAFAALGDRIYICDVDTQALAAASRAIPDAIVKPCDMSSRAEIERMVPDAAAALGGIDVLVNNAGVAGPTKPTDEMPPAEWDRTLAINITGMFDVTRLAISHLKKSQAGVIINLSSIAGRFGFANRSPYAASKWAVIGFTKTLAIELGEWGIRANAIAPGAVAGDRIERVFAGRAAISGRTVAQERDKAMAEQSIKEMVDPKDIAALAVFLASDAAKAISGQVIAIDNDRQKA